MISAQEHERAGIVLDMRVLVAGAGGLLGRLVVKELKARGHWVRSAARRERSELRRISDDVRMIDGLRPGAWRGACDDIDVVVSSLGASVNPSPFVGWRPYTRVDAPANRALVDEAKHGVGSRVRRFLYVSLIDGEKNRHLDYAEGHETVVDAIVASGLPASILRPTGFFAAMTALADIARFGGAPVFGDGLCRTNPIDERDLAALVADETLRDEPGVLTVEIGGPEIFTRRCIAEMACEAHGRRPRLVHLPPRAVDALAQGLCTVNPRAGHFTRFAVHIMTHDCLAPPIGQRRLAEAFRLHVSRRS
jgi:uncharacterized protein YbjT (DUF2867 family)